MVMAVIAGIGNSNCNANFSKKVKVYNNKEFAMPPMTAEPLSKRKKQRIIGFRKI